MNDNVSARFSLFDFLGYVIPGALSIMSFKILYELCDVQTFNLDVLCGRVLSIKLAKVSFSESVWFLIGSYLLGHLIAYFSSITVEVFSHWMHGYPSSFLLGEDNHHFFEKKPKKKEEDIIIKASRSTFFYFHLKYCENKKMIIAWWKWLVVNMVKLIISIIILPVSSCSVVLGRLFCFETFYLKQLDEETCNNVYDKAARLRKFLKLNYPPDYDADHHRVIYHYVYEKFASHRAKFDCYVAIYDFLRSITFILIALFWGILVIAIKNNIWNGGSYMLLCLVLLLSYFVYMAFMKFYRRFTLESFMCLLADPSLADPSLED